MAATATTLAMAAVMFVVVRDGGLQFDDFGNLRLAGELGTLDFVFNPVFDHFAPGHRVLTLLQSALGPTDVVAMHAVVVALHAVAIAGLLSILRRFHGAHWWVLVLAVVPVFATVSLAVELWFAAALHQVPALAASTWGIRAWVHHVDTGRRRWRFAAVGLLTLGLAFVGKALLAFGLVVLLDLFVLRPVPLRGLWPRLRDEWTTWTLLLAPVVVYLLVSTEAVTPLHPLASLDVLVDAVRETWLTRFTPSLLGLDLPQLELPRSALTAAQLGAQVVLVAVVAVSVTRRRDAVRPLLVLLAVVVVNAVMVASSRVTTFGVSSANSHRYWLEPLWYATFLLTWAWSRRPLARPTPVLPDAGPAAPRARQAPQDTTRDGDRGHRVLGALLLGLALVATGASAVAFLDDNVAYAAHDWLESARETTAAAATDGPVDLVDDTMPPAFSPPWGLADMAYLLPDATITGSARARLLADGRLVEPELEPFYDATGAEIVDNTLVARRGPEELDGDRLCTTGDLALDVLLAPAEERRFARLRLSGGRARVTSRSIGPVPAPGLHRLVLDTRTSGSELWFPLDVLPIDAAGITVSALSDEPACIDRVTLGTVPGAPDLLD